MAVAPCTAGGAAPPPGASVCVALPLVLPLHREMFVRAAFLTTEALLLLLLLFVPLPPPPLLSPPSIVLDALFDADSVEGASTGREISEWSLRHDDALTFRAASTGCT